MAIKVKKLLRLSCRVSPKEARVDKGDKVAWNGAGASASVIFQQENWPFQEPYQPTIQVSDGATAGPFTALSAFPGELHIEYDFTCGSCALKADDFAIMAGAPRSSSSKER